jgi:HK97 family phage prohead protease
MYPLSPRQQAQYEVTEQLVEVFGLFDQGIGAEGAHYVAESPFADEGMVCASCVFYEGPRACEVVSGDIAPEGICKLWVIPEQLLGLEPTTVSDEAPSMEVGDTMDDYRRTDEGMETPEREVRRVNRLELRQSEDGLPVLEGYATVYDYRYDIMGGPEAGGFSEVIAKGAAAKSAKEADVRLLVNHDGVPLARTKSGTLELESDDIGLKVRATLDPTNPAAQEVRSAMERGDLDQMSFAFRVMRESWSSDYSERTISEVKLFDVSVVTYPANPSTVVKLRADDEQAEQADEQPAGRSVTQARRQQAVDASRKRR